MTKEVSAIIEDVFILLSHNGLKNNCWFKDMNLTNIFSSTPSHRALGYLYYIKKENINSPNFFENLKDISKFQNPKTLVLFDSKSIKEVSNEDRLPYKPLLFYIILHEYCHYNDVFSPMSFQYLDCEKYSEELENRTDNMAMALFKKTKYYCNEIEQYIGL